MFDYKVIIVIISIVFLITALYKEFVRPVIAFFIVTIVLLLSGIITPNEMLSGFANEQIVIIFLLFILSDVIRQTALLDFILKNVFSQRLSYKNFLGRMMTSVAGVSAFVNNTPLVAIMMPYVYEWAKKKNISPSKVLLPLSYATILGGTITLVGTSTNLVVNGFAMQNGYPSLGMFDFTLIGIPVTIVGVAYLLFIGSKLLPDRKDALADFKEKSREYMVETLVASDSKLIGKTIEKAGLRNLRGLFIVEIIRNDMQIAPVGPTEVIQNGDVLIFAGDTDTIIDLIKSPNELTLPKHSVLPQNETAEIVEAVISSNSDLVGKLVKESNFRGKYDAAIVAINRNGERLSKKIGEVELKSGDLLLLITGEDFQTRSEENQDIYVISKIKKIGKINTFKTYVILLGTLCAFIFAALEWLSLFKGLLILMMLIAVLKIVKASDIRKTLDVDLFVILALSLALGKAISNSGVATIFATSIINLVNPFGSKVLILLAIYIITNILAMLVTNKAAVAITFPISIATAAQLGLSDHTPFILVVAFAGCAEFMTPYGYQTNLMVYGPGGYKFKDYIRVGWGLTVLYMVTCVTILGVIYKLY